MEFYKGEKTLEDQIVRQGHSFIYGEDCDCRTKFLRGIEERHPIEPGNNPAVLYLDQFGFKGDAEPSDRIINSIYTMNNQYLAFSIIARILERTPNNCDLSELINSVNRLFKRKDVKIETIEELLGEIVVSRDFYNHYYYEFINGKVNSLPLSDIAIPKIILDRFIERYKQAMDMQSHFALILDHKQPISTPSVKVVNNLIGARISGWLSINVATNPNNWETFDRTSKEDRPIQKPHDYKEIYLDDSYQKTIGTFKQQKGL